MLVFKVASGSTIIHFSDSLRAVLITALDVCCTKYSDTPKQYDMIFSITMCFLFPKAPHLLASYSFDLKRSMTQQRFESD